MRQRIVIPNRRKAIASSEIGLTTPGAIQRQCAHCAAEEQRMSGSRGDVSSLEDTGLSGGGQVEGKALPLPSARYGHGLTNMALLPRDRGAESAREVLSPGTGVPQAEDSRFVQRQEDTTPATANVTAMDGDTVSLPPVEIDSVSEEIVAFGRSLHLQGKTTASFSRSARLLNQQATRATGCMGCPPTQCLHVTGTQQNTYRATTKVSLPAVPRGLTPCERQKAQDAIDQVLAPHEQQHVQAFHTYDGTTSLPFDQTLCQSQIPGAVQAQLDAENATRQAAAQAASDALDPFNFDFDLDCDSADATGSTPGDNQVAANAAPNTLTATPGS